MGSSAKATPPPSATANPTPTPGVNGYGASGSGGADNAGAGAPLATIQGQSATAPAPSSIASSVWPVLPNSIGNEQFNMETAGAPGEKKGTGKGAHDPNLTKIGDLVRI